MHCQCHMQEAHLQKCLRTAKTSDTFGVAHACKCSGCRSCKRLPAKPAMKADHQQSIMELTEFSTASIHFELSCVHQQA